MSPVTASGDLEIVYETFGDPADPPLLLVSGFTRQLIGWSTEFVSRLVDGGRFVVVYDNRDCGLSTKLTRTPADLPAIGTALASGDGEAARALLPYTLSDMAGDGLAVLDALAIDRAHVLGVSMGGMIAQAMAIEHPARLLSLTSVMSRTGEPGYGDASPEAGALLTSPPATDRETAMDRAEAAAIWRSRRWPEIERERELAARSFDRDHTLGTGARQLAAILASGSRADGLRALTMPALVIHGRDDTLIAPSGGERTAQLIPGAKLMLVDDMGHDLPVPLLDEICAAILAHTG